MTPIQTRVIHGFTFHLPTGNTRFLRTAANSQGNPAGFETAWNHWCRWDCLLLGVECRWFLLLQLLSYQMHPWSIHSTLLVATFTVTSDLVSLILDVPCVFFGTSTMKGLSYTPEIFAQTLPARGPVPPSGRPQRLRRGSSGPSGFQHSRTVSNGTFVEILGRINGSCW